MAIPPGGLGGYAGLILYPDEPFKNQPGCGGGGGILRGGGGWGKRGAGVFGGFPALGGPLRPPPLGALAGG